MSSTSNRAAPSPAFSRSRTVLGSALILVVSIGVSFWLLSPSFHWALRMDLLPFLLPSLLRPETGMLSLTAVILLLLGVPSLLARVRTADPRPAVPSGGGTVPEQRIAAIAIPIGAITDLDPSERHEAALALEIEWDDAYGRDDRRWEQAYRTGLRDALEILRNGR